VSNCRSCCNSVLANSDYSAVQRIPALVLVRLRVPDLRCRSTAPAGDHTTHFFQSWSGPTQPASLEMVKTEARSPINPHSTPAV
jgi:hypothetical protein